MNNENTVKFAYMRRTARLSLKAQQDAAKAAGYDSDNWVVEGDGGKSIRSLVGADGSGAPPILRKGYWLGVYRFELVAEPRTKKGDRAPRKTLRDITDKLREIGVVVEEFESGRNCKTGDDMLDMYADAVDRLAGDKKQQAGPGRPKMHTYSDADCQLIAATWNRKELKNPQERA